MQSTITLLTIETEYMAVIEVMKEVIWLKGLVCDLSLQQELTVVYCDSQSATHLTKNKMFHERTKHTDVRMHFTRDVISKGAIVLRKNLTMDHPSNMMTKFIPTIKFNHCLDLIGVSGI